MVFNTSDDAIFGLLILSGLVYYTFLLSDIGGGQTLGCKAVGIILVKDDEDSPPQIAKTFLWYLTFSFAGLIGWIWHFTNSDRKMLHNMASSAKAINKG